MALKNHYYLIDKAYFNRMDRRFWILSIDSKQHFFSHESVLSYLNLPNEKKGIKTMKLSEKLNAMKNDAISTANNSNLSLAEKMAMKKGIIQENAELTINKFAEVEALRKTIKGLEERQTGLEKKIDGIYNDIGKFIASLKQTNNNVLENNALLIAIQKQLTNISTIEQKTVINKGKDKTEKKSESVTIKTDEKASNDIESFYKAFMKNYGNKFMGSKKTDNLIAFQTLFNAIDFDSPESIADSMAKEWTRFRSENAANNKGNVSYWAPLNKANVINAMLKTVNDFEGKETEKPIATNQSASTVLNKAYFIESMNLSESAIDEIIDTVKDHGLNKDSMALIREFIAEQKGKELKAFWQWVKRFHE